MGAITKMPISLKKRYKVQSDPKQTILAPNITTGVKFRNSDVSIEIDMEQPIVTCPFCLYYGCLHEFRVKTKRGFSERRAKCPECGEGMTMETLTKSASTPEEFADWVFTYGRSFWQKCSYKKFNKRLKKLGWLYRFWKRYKELKGESYEEEQERMYDEMWQDYVEYMKEYGE